MKKILGIILIVSLTFGIIGNTFSYTDDGGEVKTNKSYNNIYFFKYSPVGKSYAFLTIQNNKFILVKDGKEIDQYERVYSFKYGPNGQNFVFKAKKDGKFILVKNGKESYKYDEITFFQYSPNGESFSFVAKKQEKWVLIKDGNESAEYEYINNFYYSSDGKNLIFKAKKDGKYTVVEYKVNGDSVNAQPKQFITTPVEEKNIPAQNNYTTQNTKKSINIKFKKSLIIIGKKLESSGNQKEKANVDFYIKSITDSELVLLHNSMVSGYYMNIYNDTIKKYNEKNGDEIPYVTNNTIKFNLAYYTKAKAGVEIYNRNSINLVNPYISGKVFIKANNTNTNASTNITGTQINSKKVIILPKISVLNNELRIVTSSLKRKGDERLLDDANKFIKSLNNSLLMSRYYKTVIKTSLNGLNIRTTTQRDNSKETSYNKIIRIKMGIAIYDRGLSATYFSKYKADNTNISNNINTGTKTIDGSINEIANVNSARLRFYNRTGDIKYIDNLVKNYTDKDLIRIYNTQTNKNFKELYRNKNSTIAFAEYFRAKLGQEIYKRNSIKLVNPYIRYGNILKLKNISTNTVTTKPVIASVKPSNVGQTTTKTINSKFATSAITSLKKLKSSGSKKEIANADWYIKSISDLDLILLHNSMISGYYMNIYNDIVKKHNKKTGDKIPYITNNIIKFNLAYYIKGRTAVEIYKRDSIKLVDSYITTGVSLKLR